MFSKIWFNIRTFFHLFFRGLNQADKVAFGSKEESLNKDLSIEQQQEVDCVWNDLIKGEVTQRVKDLRYETAHAVRESKHYEYIGNGIAKKRTMYEYKGIAENSEGYDIVIVQDNSKIIKGVGDAFDNPIIEYDIKVIAPFKLKHRVDSYLKKVILRKDNEGKHYLDLYFSKYLEKYNNVHKFFLSELTRIYEGKDMRSDILLINSVEFITKNAYGDNDDVVYKISLSEFRDIKEFDGNYVLTFHAKIKEKDDLIRLVYDEKSAEKFNNKTARDEKKASVKYSDIQQEDEIKKKNDDFYKQYKSLFDELESDGE